MAAESAKSKVTIGVAQPLGQAPADGTSLTSSAAAASGTEGAPAATARAASDPRPARLRLESGELWLEDDVDVPERRRLVDPNALRYRSGRLRDTLELEAERYELPRGSGGAVRALLLRARLGQAEPRAEEGALGARDACEDAVVGRWLHEDEALLVWARTARTLRVPSPLEDLESECDATLVVTTHRAALLAIGPLGDVVWKPLEGRASIESSIGRSALRVGEELVACPLGRADSFALAARLLAEDALGRRRELALGLRRAKPELAARLLGEAAAAGDACSAALQALESGSDDALADAVAKLLGEHPTPETWLSLVERWGIAADARLRLVRALGVHEDARSAALALLESLRVASARKPDEAVRADLELAPLFVQLDAQSRGSELLRAHLEALPPPIVLDLVPPLPPKDEPRALRLRVELLEALDGLEPHRRDELRRELLQLHPFDARRASLAFERPSLAERVARVQRMLAPGAMSAPRELPATASRPLGAAQLQGRLRHPLARDRTVSDRLQSFIAESDAPDAAAIRSHAERLGAGPAEDALVSACIALGAAGVEAFVSKGNKPYGLRIYPGKPPLLLIGKEHLAGGAYELGPTELAFAIGAEVAHLVFGHARVSEGELYAGALETGRATLSLLITVLPIAERFAHWGSKLGAAEKIGEALGKLSFPGKKKRAEGDQVGPSNEELVAAHRLMQLSADRAGLVLSGDLVGAVRAMILTTPSARAELRIVDQLGAGVALERRDAQGALLHPMLALRVAALVAFYVDDDYEALRASLAPITPG